MRISSGYLRNMPLTAPPGDSTRPTPEKVRQAIFNSLANKLEKAHVLDIFAGTGAFGIEALSRGAKSCVFVESAKTALQALKKNIEEAERRFIAQNLPPPEQSIIQFSFPDGMKKIPKNQQFDIIWLDPPYSYSRIVAEEIFEFARDLMQKDACLVMESESADQNEIVEIAKDYSHFLELAATKTYGRSSVTTWVKI